VFKLGCFVLSLLVLTIPRALAAEPANGEATPPEGGQGEAPPVVEEKPMTQGDLAVAIVRMLGLESEIDANIGAKATLLLNPDIAKQVYANFLASRGIHPLGGWKINEPVTKEVLAVVVVQVLGLLAEVEHPDNPDDYIAVLEAHDIILTSVRDVLSEIEVINPVVQIPGVAGLYFENLSAIRGF
jgi:hypothetical protein